MPDLYTLTKTGCDWSEVVNEIEWLQEQEGDLSETMQAIENQLGHEYWESEEEFTITVSPAIAETIRKVANNDAAERAALDHRLAERDRQS